MMVKKSATRRPTRTRATKKKEATEKSVSETTEQEESQGLAPITTELEFRSLEVAHLFKYNVYLLAKALVFHSVYPDAESIEDAIEATEHVIGELDLDTKQLRQQALARQQAAEAKEAE